jgi:hypothetical protein
LSFFQFCNFAKAALCYTKNKAVKNVPRRQHCVTWTVTQCYDEKTLFSFRYIKIIANAALGPPDFNKVLTEYFYYYIKEFIKYDKDIKRIRQNYNFSLEDMSFKDHINIPDLIDKDFFQHRLSNLGYFDDYEGEVYTLGDSSN